MDPPTVRDDNSLNLGALGEKSLKCQGMQTSFEKDRDMLLCPGSGDSYPFSAKVWRCPSCGGPLAIAGGRQLDRELILRGPRSIWRYRQAFPSIADDAIVTMGEGMTPLVSASIEGSSVLLKVDYLEPTGSFKDRGASVLVSFLKQAGISHVTEDSSGMLVPRWPPTRPGRASARRSSSPPPPPASGSSRSRPTALTLSWFQARGRRWRRLLGTGPRRLITRATTGTPSF